MAETLSNYEEDRLSSLPDTLLVDILSFIPFKSAVATSILSRRWCYLWTQLQLPHLFLDWPWPRASDSDHSEKFFQFINTVDNIFNRITSPLIKTFHLHIPYPQTAKNDEFEVCSAYLKSWIRRVCVLKVAKIKVSCDFPYYLGPHVRFPSCVFDVESLVELELGGNLCCELPETEIVSLPNLKKLVLIDLPTNNRSVFETLFKSCPLLEMLSLEIDEDSANSEYLTISAQNLKSLIIRGKSRHFVFTIKAPLLQHIEIRGFLGLYRFDQYPSRLVRADLDISNFSYSRIDFIRYIPKLVQGISSVESLNLLNGLSVFNALDSLDFDVGSVFHNLVHLTLDLSKNEKDWGDRNPIPICLLSRLKKIKLLNTQGNANDVKLLEYILSNATVLDRLYISSVHDGYGDDDGERGQVWREYKLSRTMLLVPRNTKITINVEDPLFGQTPTDSP
ncbi:F-box/LRR-repeat protein 13-like [Chenopodium quinoa]|uniref:F-box domain-containing protein n=1 Tax=Chenopodium quinoa TaxID=63459 RepID=A0A803LUC7_CHEQI|nr:F-box/LRR-repeat protein 13-like [Chenopodium quinoa]